VNRPEDVARIGAKFLGYAIKNICNPNIGLFAGNTAGRIYHEFFREFNANQMSNITQSRFFSVSEHFGVSPNATNSYYYWFHEAFFNKISENWKLDISEDHKKLVPATIEQETWEGFRIRYNNLLQNNKVDVQLMSPAPDGQFISIDPDFCSLTEMLNMGASLVKYSKETSKRLVPEGPVDMDIVIGMKNLLSRSEHLVILASGPEKRIVMRRMILGPVNSDCPASLIGRYPNKEKLLFVIDKACSEGLPREYDRYLNLIDPDHWQEIW